MNVYLHTATERTIDLVPETASVGAQWNDFRFSNIILCYTVTFFS